MLTQTPVYIVAAGEDLSPATALSMPCLHLAYTLGSQGQLHREGPESRSSGGLLGLYDNGLTSPLSLDPRRLAGQIREECSRRRFSGLVLDAHGPAAGELVSALSPLLDQWSFPYYVPIKLASLAPNACFLLPSTLYEGSFDNMLEQYCRRYPVHRLALDVVRQCRRFPMPSQDDPGEELSAQEFFRLQREYEPVSFFSQELCARCGIPVRYINLVHMVDNWLPAFDMEEEQRKDKHVEEQLAAIQTDVAQKVAWIAPVTEADRAAHQAFLAGMRLAPPDAWQHLLRVSQDCIGCGICQRVCPSASIRLVEGRAEHVPGRCQTCLACAHVCPRKAVQLTVPEKNPSARYRNPHVTLQELIQANQQPGCAGSAETEGGRV